MTKKMYPYQDAYLPLDQRLDDLMARMTREEKVAQCCQFFVNPDNREEMQDRIRKHGLGSRILAGSNLAGSGNEKKLEVEDLNELQRLAVEDTRLGIPLLHGRDVIHGYRTIFPIPLGMAAAWNPEMTEMAYRVAAKEAASAGVHWAFAPMLDLARDPRWGRIAEGSGEDPYLAAKLAAAAVHGFQGNELSSPESVVACAKHYIGYGAAEGGRDYNTSEITDTTLRNFYLPAYQAAFDAGVGTVMSAFQDLNGESTSGSRYLLTELLRDGCGFNGFVVSDWGSVQELVNHRVAADRHDAARLGFDAGVDMEMVTECYYESLSDLVEKGEISAGRLDEAARKILTVKFQLGLFEHPYADPQKIEQVQFTSQHTTLARQFAQQSIVLLKNENGLLPLPKEKHTIAVMGPLAHQRASLLGCWTLDGRSDETQTIYEALCEADPQANLPRISDSMTDEMQLAALRADVVVLVVGESSMRSGENNNVATIDLPPGQDELIEAICALGKPVVLVVCAGRPLNLSRAVRCAGAILYAWHPGSKGAAAIADVLFGEMVPSGKLPVTFPRATGQIPMHYNFKSTGKNFDAVGRPVSGRYEQVDRYQDLRGAPLFPFGYGLSYTTFSYRDVHVDRQLINAGETVLVSANITNTGKMAGVEIAQCYVQDCMASITRPVRELKGFTRVALQPGETRQVTFALGTDELSFYGKDGKRRLEPGSFRVWVGGNCESELGTEFAVE